MAVSPASAYADTRAPHPRRSGASTSAHSSHDALVDGLDATLRELVRREGVDPQRDADVVRRLAEGVVRRHDDHSLTGAVAPLADPDAVVGELLARVSGFGPLQPLLEDPTVEEIWINDPTRVFVARRGRHELTNLVLTRAQVDELVERMLKSSGRRIDLSRPFVDAMLPEGHRLHVVLEGISRGFSAVKTAMLKTTANVGVHGASTANPSSARNLRTDQSRPHWAGARRSAADSGVPRALPVSRLA
jgi:pilus assembly protein CpaF